VVGPELQNRRIKAQLRTEGNDRRRSDEGAHRQIDGGGGRSSLRKMAKGEATTAALKVKEREREPVTRATATEGTRLGGGGAGGVGGDRGRGGRCIGAAHVVDGDTDRAPPHFQFFKTKSSTRL
jgi:hypothetical protein